MVFIYIYVSMGKQWKINGKYSVSMGKQWKIQCFYGKTMENIVLLWENNGKYCVSIGKQWKKSENEKNGTSE